MRRTHTCGELKKEDIDKNVVLNGWVDTRRDHGGLIFIDIRDRYGFTQIAFSPEKPESFKLADSLRREDVIEIRGAVKARPEGMENTKLPTGAIEVWAEQVEVLNKSDVPPIEIDDRVNLGEDIRLKYRYLDLRRPVMQKNLLIRHKAALAAREYLSGENFLEVETPMFVKHTPGGARVFKVPSRVHPGKFYALPESPQLYKQLLMVAGCDRYFQLARCLRDEDLRQDRQPEFTQIDIEMSFIEEEDIYHNIEGLFKKIFKDAIGKDIPTPFPRMTYHEAMSRYGSDSPDIRFGLELKEVTAIAEKSDFSVFKSAIEKKGVVYCLNAKGCGIFSRKDIDVIIELGKLYKLPGIAWIKVSEGKKLESSVVKYFNEEVQKEIMEKVKAEEGDLLLFAADKFEKACNGLGQIRKHIAEKQGLIKEGNLKFCWVTDFPLYEYSEEENKWVAMHHIFSMPQDECFQYLPNEPGKVLGKLYDCVLNGVEVAGGSIRIHRKDIQQKVLAPLGISYEEAEKTFDFLLTAFRYGAPPHGGIAVGFDRLCALLVGQNDIREVIAFPKSKSAENPMDGSPQNWEDKFLKDLHMKLDIVKK